MIFDSAAFELNERLQNDSAFVARIGFCQIRLCKDSRYPWLLLIPEITELSELDDLSWEQQIAVLKISNLLSQVFKQAYQAHKLNIACLGNIVKQLHIHHIARFEYDESWPYPIWGMGEARLYTNDVLVGEIAKIRKALSHFYQGELDVNNNNE